MTDNPKRPAVDVYIGIGGWTYAPWRNTFYPKGLPQKDELEYASRHVSAIEVNGTFYRTQSPATFAKWRKATPDHFRFSVKAPRYATHRRALSEAGESIERFLSSGVAELDEKLGPILWQFPSTKQFEPEDFARFLALLPRRLGRRALSHVLDVRHKSFLDSDFLTLARRHNAATVFCDSDRYPSFADVTSDFIYARLMRCESSVKTGYASSALETWAKHVRSWSHGKVPRALPRIEKSRTPYSIRRVFVFMIDGAKERAPSAARALLERLA